MSFCKISNESEVSQVDSREPDDDEMQAVFDNDLVIVRYKGNKFQFLVVTSVADEDEEDSETDFHWTNAYE